MEFAQEFRKNLDALQHQYDLLFVENHELFLQHIKTMYRLMDEFVFPFYILTSKDSQLKNGAS